MRALGGNAPNAVGFEVEAFRLTFDIADGVTNPTGVRMDANDLAGGGACGVAACSENQVRKVNVGARHPLARAVRRHEGSTTTNTLFTQVALRSLAFVNRYGRGRGAATVDEAKQPRRGAARRPCWS